MMAFYYSVFKRAKSPSFWDVTNSTKYLLPITTVEYNNDNTGINTPEVVYNIDFWHWITKSPGL